MFPPVEQALADLEKAVVDLQGALNRHTFYRGTYDSVLTEAQNGLIPKPGGGTFKHLESLKQGKAEAEKAVQKVRSALKELRRFDHKSANALEDALKPLVGPAGQAGKVGEHIIGLADRKIDLAGRTLELVRELEILHPERLGGVPLAAKGRTEKALTTSQLDKLGVQAVNPGVVDHPQWKRLLAEIAQEPMDGVKLGEQVAAANRAVGAALRSKLGAGVTAPVRRFAASLSARFDAAGRLATAAGLPLAHTGAVALKRQAVHRQADKLMAQGTEVVEKKLAASATGDGAKAVLRKRLAKAAAGRIAKIAESRVARRALSMAPVVGWGFSAADAWNGGKDVIRGNVGRGLSGIGLAVADVASDFLHLGDAVSGVGGTALSLAAQGGTIAGQVTIEMSRVQEQMDRVLAEVDRTGQLPPDGRLRTEFELDDDTITELKGAMSG